MRTGQGAGPASLGPGGKEPACQCRRHGSDPWVGKVPWRWKWQPTLVFLPGKAHGRRSLEGYKEADPAERLNNSQQTADKRRLGNGQRACEKMPN